MMVTKLLFTILIGIAFAAMLGVLSGTELARGSVGGASGQIEDDARAAVSQVRQILPTSAQMVDNAVAVLSQGWGDMSPAEKELFNLIFDPGRTGEIDEAYVGQALHNYRKIGSGFEKAIDVAYAGDSEHCLGERLYFVDLSTLHVCPQLLVDRRELRKARVIIHEVAHWELTALDRPYFGRDSQEYAELSPQGHWSAGLPFIGPLLREMFRSDTLFHPDAYAHFAIAVSGQPGALELYLGVETKDTPGASAGTSTEAVSMFLTDLANSSER
jgi:hypothetical protein